MISSIFNIYLKLHKMCDVGLKPETNTKLMHSYQLLTLIGRAVTVLRATSFNEQVIIVIESWRLFPLNKKYLAC